VDTFRYVVALAVVTIAPGIFVFWFSVHPLIGVWRRLGARPTLWIHFALGVLLAVPVVYGRGWLLGAEYGSNPLGAGAGAALLAVGAWLRIRINHEMPSHVLAGVPELEPESRPGGLVTSGIYARVRHPRYAQMVLLFLAYALICNYLAAYVVFVLSIPWALGVAVLEERELRVRFGEAYERYALLVPRFVPRRSTSTRRARA